MLRIAVVLLVASCGDGSNFRAVCAADRDCEGGLRCLTRSVVRPSGPGCADIEQFCSQTCTSNADCDEGTCVMQCNGTFICE